jgi:hypothetical protein
MKAFTADETSVGYEVEDEENWRPRVGVYFDAVPDDADEEEDNALSFTTPSAILSENALTTRPRRLRLVGARHPRGHESGLDAINCARLAQGR